MRAAVHHVHHRRGQAISCAAIQVLIERHALGRGGGAGGGHRDAEDGVGSQAGLGRRAIQGDHLVVEGLLVGRVDPDDGRT